MARPQDGSRASVTQSLFLTDECLYRCANPVIASVSCPAMTGMIPCASLNTCKVQAQTGRELRETNHQQYIDFLGNDFYAFYPLEASRPLQYLWGVRTGKTDYEMDTRADGEEGTSDKTFGKRNS